ncbi:MAG: hypothetical protein KatS3mg114_0625 [Planctomycetaceae bacterium]|nr:MAG: hypothetical protein KatS3mg114_0625 [Planctomycetaceae bacterium]
MTESIQLRGQLRGKLLLELLHFLLGFRLLLGRFAPSPTPRDAPRNHAPQTHKPPCDVFLPGCLVAHVPFSLFHPRVGCQFLRTGARWNKPTPAAKLAQLGHAPCCCSHETAVRVHTPQSFIPTLEFPNRFVSGIGMQVHPHPSPPDIICWVGGVRPIAHIDIRRDEAHRTIG